MSKALEQLQQSIEAQKKRLTQMLAEKQQMEARAKAVEKLKAKKADTRRKILLGAFVLSRLERENATIDVRTLTIDGARFASWLSRPEDRALFSFGESGVPASDTRHEVALTAITDKPAIGLPLQLQVDAVSGPEDRMTLPGTGKWAFDETDDLL